jgi:glycosidase
MKGHATLNLLLSGFVLSAACAAPGDDAGGGGGGDTGGALGKADGDDAEVPAADGPDGIDGVKRWARERLGVAEDAFANRGRARMPSPDDWADQVVYQIQVDRFNNGDHDNDGRNVSEHQRAHRFRDQLGLSDYHHGGDLRGITERIDYLADLGVTALWITPVLMGNGSYHGYCTTDFTRIDPNFGTANELRDLTARAHDRGIRVVLDVVVNHMCSNDSHYDDERTPFSGFFYGQCVNDLERKRWTGGGEVRGRRELVFGNSLFPPFRSPHFFSRCGFVPGDFATHGSGALFGDFSDRMLDLDTMNWDFQEIFTDLHKFWIAYADVDGFRVDAAKHVTEDFLAYFATETREYAASLGKESFFLVGEVAASTEEIARRVGRMRSNPWSPGDRSANIPETLRNRLHSLRDRYLDSAFGLPGLNAGYDFAHSGTAVDVMHQNRSPLDVKSWYWAGGETDHSSHAGGFAELSQNGYPLLNWNILEIHDWPRFGQIEFGGDRPRALAQLSTALGYLLTGHGVPVLYYGVEQGLDGNCPDPSRIGGISEASRREVRHVCSSWEHTRYRQDMFVEGPWRLRSLVGSVDGLSHIGFDENRSAPSGWRNDPYLDRDHALYQWVRRLIAVRRSCGALRRGAIYFRAAHGAPGGLLAFSRVLHDREVVVLVNTGDHAIGLEHVTVDASLHRGRDFAVWRNLLNGFETATAGALNGGMGIYFAEGYALPPHSVAVFAPDDRGFGYDNVTDYDARVGAHLCHH